MTVDRFSSEAFPPEQAGRSGLLLAAVAAAATVIAQTDTRTVQQGGYYEKAVFRPLTAGLVTAYTYRMEYIIACYLYVCPRKRVLVLITIQKFLYYVLYADTYVHRNIYGSISTYIHTYHRWHT